MSVTVMTEQDQRISEVFGQERGRLRSFIRKRVPNEYDVEDLLQEVFFELVRAQRLLLPIDYVSGWLFRVARNRITDLFRKKKPETFADQMAEDDEGESFPFEDLLPSADAGPEASYFRSLLLDELEAALAELPGNIDYVFIHDCARPLIRPEQLIALHKIVRREEAVALAHRVTDTIKEHRGKGRLRGLDRSRLWAMETPQVFSKALIDRAYALVARKRMRITDDVAAVELVGHPVALLENVHPNPKLTLPSDLALIEFLLAPGA